MMVPEDDLDVGSSPMTDESVVGFHDDKQPAQQGVQEMLEVTKLLKEAGIPCCMVAEAALIYYGASRILNQSLVCVPTDKVDAAAVTVRSHGDTYMSFRPSAMYRLGSFDHLYPRFKLVGVALFFVIIPALDCHLQCEPANFEFGQTGIPFPKLDVYAQSLLDTGNLVDLQDLIDGMNLSSVWGEDHLALDGTTDVEWAKWKIEILEEQGEKLTGWDNTPRNRRDLWLEATSVDRKRRGQGWKYRESHETRFWKRGQKDPRMRKGGF